MRLEFKAKGLLHSIPNAENAIYYIIKSKSTSTFLYKVVMKIGSTSYVIATFEDISDAEALVHDISGLVAESKLDCCDLTCIGINSYMKSLEYQLNR